jgi:predicted exporter
MRFNPDGMTSGHRLGFALAWLALLLVAGWFVGQHLQLSGDLRKFMPPGDSTTTAGTFQAAGAADTTRSRTVGT